MGKTSVETRIATLANALADYHEAKGRADERRKATALLRWWSTTVNTVVHKTSEGSESDEVPALR